MLEIPQRLCGIWCKIRRVAVEFAPNGVYIINMYERILDMASLAEQKSFFLFGPRSTGKSWLLRHSFPQDAIIDLLKSSTYLPLAQNPSFLENMVRERAGTGKPVVIDEIQKLPALLDEVHRLIENTGTRFIMTGSSARKLRRGGVNLLAGRAWQANLFPLVYKEIPGFNIDRYLRYGGLPQVYGSARPEEELDAYINTYLKEEIQEEALVQNLPKFSRFLKTASFCNAEQINFTNIANDAAMPASTVRSYFDLLRDTFTGFFIESWQDSKKRKAVSTPKFYFFDTGLANGLSASYNFSRESSEYGKAFEHFLAMELRAWISYKRNRLELFYWRTRTGTEVDFFIPGHFAVEVKTTRTVSDQHLKGLRALKEENAAKDYFLVSFDSNNHRTSDGIRCLHWKTFLDELWG